MCKLRLLLSSAFPLYQVLISIKASHDVNEGIVNLSSIKTRSAANGYTRNNFTHKEVANILRGLGYHVQEFPGEDPLAFIGDSAYLPRQIIPELAPSRERTTALSDKRIWKKNGIAQAWYFFDTETIADKKVFESCVIAWGENTCIQFNKLSPARCTRTINHGSICVGNFGGCWSMVGNIFAQGQPPQKMSVQPNGCELVAAVHEFGHSLGLYHQQSRPDRDEHLIVRNENFQMPDDGQESSLSSTWAQGGRCNQDQVVDLPIPYDYMSLMQYASSSFSDFDQRPIFVTKDGHFQYMLDYHRRAGMLFSFYDLYTVNTVYGCVDTWTKACQNNGNTPPKCQHLGYIGKNCKCHCPPAYKGSACETKKGPLFPLLEKAKTMVDVRKLETIDIGSYQLLRTKGDGVIDNFKFFQYFTIIADNSDEKTHTYINVHQNVRNMDVFQSAHVQQFIINRPDYMDCEGSTKALWGLNKVGNLRTECLSSIANNEPEGPMFRSKTHHLDLFTFSFVGQAFSDIDMTAKLLSLKLNVVFAAHAGKLLKAQQFASSGDDGDDSIGGKNGGDNVGDSGGGNTTHTVDGAARALTATGSSGIIVGVVLVALAAVGVATVLVVRHKHLLNADKLFEVVGLENNSSDSSDSTKSESSTLKESNESTCKII